MLRGFGRQVGSVELKGDVIGRLEEVGTEEGRVLMWLGRLYHFIPKREAVIEDSTAHTGDGFEHGCMERGLNQGSWEGRKQPGLGIDARNICGWLYSGDTHATCVYSVARKSSRWHCLLAKHGCAEGQFHNRAWFGWVATLQSFWSKVKE